MRLNSAENGQRTAAIGIINTRTYPKPLNSEGNNKAGPHVGSGFFKGKAFEGR